LFRRPKLTLSCSAEGMEGRNLPSGPLCGNGVTGKLLTQSVGLLPDVEKMKHKSASRFHREVGSICKASDLHSGEEGFESQSGY
jgi:hypothetical protein